MKQSCMNRRNKELKNTKFRMKNLLLSSIIILTLSSYQLETKLRTGWYYLCENKSHGEMRELLGHSDTFCLNPEIIIGTEHFQNFIRTDSFITDEHVVYELILQFDSVGKSKFNIATTIAAVNKDNLAFIFNDTLIQVAKVQSQVNSGSFVVLNRSLDKVALEELKLKLISEIELNRK